MECIENTRELDDMEHKLDADKPWDEYSRRLLWELSDCLTSDEQVKNKGKLLYASKSDKRNMFYRGLFALSMVAGSLFLMKVSMYFAILSVAIAVVLAYWLWMSSKKCHMFIEIYEHAIVGAFEFARERELKQLEKGNAYYKIAREIAGNVYITLYDDSVCRLRYMKDGKKIAYFLNKQKGMEKNGYF